MHYHGSQCVIANLPATIVFVEEDEDIGGLILPSLGRAGLALRCHKSARSSDYLEAESQPPAIFLLDLLLPGPHGFQLWRSIKKHDF
jgi:DNA-binding response OmpR family regulator